MTQLLCHLWGEYILQSDWMAQNKTKASVPACIHAVVYSLTLILLTHSWKALTVIVVTHFFIDRFRLARFVVEAKNVLGQPYGEFLAAPNQYSTATGYPKGVPDWMAVWLFIVADNILHLTINYLALRYL
jgi:hypothetical protein